MEQYKNDEATEILNIVNFKIGGNEFSIDMPKVKEINSVMLLTKIQSAPPFAVGIINSDEEVIPVFDLRLKLKLPKIEYGDNNRVIIAELNDRRVGFVVDEVTEVSSIPKSITEIPSPTVYGIESEYISVVDKLVKGLLLLSDLEKILDETKVNMLEAV